MKRLHLYVGAALLTAVLLIAQVPQKRWILASWGGVNRWVTLGPGLIIDPVKNEVSVDPNFFPIAERVEYDVTLPAAFDAAAGKTCLTLPAGVEKVYRLDVLASHADGSTHAFHLSSRGATPAHPLRGTAPDYTVRGGIACLHPSFGDVATWLFTAQYPVPLDR